MLGIDLIIACAVPALIAAARAVGFLRRRSMARQITPTFVFADLVGYTAAADEYGDEAAARLASDFRRGMAVLSRRHGARPVKSLGDGAMIWAPDPARAVALVASMLDELGSRPDLLPVRVGVHTGPAVMRDGDWYGSAVNVAARLAGAAGPNQALVSDITQSAVVSELRSRLCYQGRLVLRGLRRPIAVWRLTLQEAPAPALPLRPRLLAPAPAVESKDAAAGAAIPSSV
jgi:adenylate cyclase